MKQPLHRSYFLLASIPRDGYSRLNFLTDLLKLTRSVGLTLLGAGAVFLLRQLSPDSLSWVLSPRPPFRSQDSPCLTVPGLRNAGNNCFLNAVLQALSSSEILLTFLGAYDKEKVRALFSSIEDSCPMLPLSEALADLLGELSGLTSEPFIASPRHVMLALEQYAKQFNLSLQQDAAEALAHLIDALQTERSMFYESFKSYKESLSCTSGICTNESPMKRIIEGDSKKEASPLYSWKQQFRFPISGTMGSMLTCLKCGFQFSTQFQSFYDVPLSPPQWPDGNIVDGCSLQNCLEQFTAPECISNVRCSRCSHALILSLLKQRSYLKKVLVQRIEQCTFGDDCCCEDLVKREGEVWRNVYVNALKQLRFGQCPEMLCCQVQRAVFTRSGELMKLTHRILFPFILDLSPYTMSSYSREKYSPPSMTERKYYWQRSAGEMRQKNETSFNKVLLSSDELNSDGTHLSVCSGSKDVSSDSPESNNGQLNEDIAVVKLSSGPDSMNMCGERSFYVDDNVSFTKIREILTHPDYNNGPLRPNFQSHGNSTVLCEPGSEPACDNNGIVEIPISVNSVQRSEATTLSFVNSGMKNDQSSGNLAANHQFDTQKWLYDLISVVVHSGSPKAGHYTVYRRVRLKSADIQEVAMTHGSPELGKVLVKEHETEKGDAETILWFRVSDSHVDLVTEEDVLKAQVSLLFYERRHDFL